MTPIPDDCYYCGQTLRWTNRIDNKNKMKQFWNMYREREQRLARQRYIEEFGEPRAADF